MLDMHMHAVHSGDMKLAQYLSDQGMTDDAFAAKVGLSQSQISRIKRGVSRPSWDSIAAIERETGGEVGPGDFAQQAEVIASRREDCGHDQSETAA